MKTPLCTARLTAQPVRLVLALLLALASVPLAAAPSYQFTTLAGSAGGPGQAGGPRLSARLNYPAAAAIDAAGNLFIADYGNNVVRRIDTNGLVTVFAGMAGAPGNLDGPAAAARFNGPASVAADRAGNLYVADTGNNAIRRITPAGMVSTFAGAWTNVGGADGLGAAAQFRSPTGVAVDAAGDVYVADYGNNAIRKITPDGTVTTLAGVAGTNGAADGPGISATFFHPVALAVDGTGNVYVADSDNCTIRLVQPDGTVSTLAGAPGVVGYQEGVGPAAQFRYPQGITVDSDGIVYVADTGNQMIRCITPDRTVSAIAGTPGVSGSQDGSVGSAQFGAPAGLIADLHGALYVADQENHSVRKVTIGGMVETWVGGAPNLWGMADGPAASTLFSAPRGLALDGAGNLYIADDWNLALRMLATNGVVSTVADLSAWLTNLWSVAVDSAGDVFGGGTAINTSYPAGVQRHLAGSLILKVTAGQSAVPFAGGRSPVATASFPVSDGVGTNAAFDGLSALLAAPSGVLFVADGNLNAVREIQPDGTVTTLAGAPSPYPVWDSPEYGAAGFSNGTNSGASFASPAGLALGADGALFVADHANNAIRKVTPAGVVTTVAGFVGPVTSPSTGRLTAAPGYLDGPVSLAQFSLPTAIAVDAAGTLFIADQQGTVIRMITTNGVVATIAGLAGAHGVSDGVGAAATFSGVQAMTIDGAGNLYLADSGNNRIVKGIAVAPLVLSATRSGGVTTLVLTSPAPGSFRIEATAALDATADWEAVDGLADVTVPAGPSSWVDAGAGGAARYYRAVQLP